MDDVDKDINISEQKRARWIKEEKRIECNLLSSCIQREWGVIIASYVECTTWCWCSIVKKIWAGLGEGFDKESADLDVDSTVHIVPVCEGG